MKFKSKLFFSFSTKLILVFILLLSISSLITGLTAYLVARNELNRKGGQILKNSVVQSIDLIESEHERLNSAHYSLETLQEHIKEVLMGPLDPQLGIRTLHHRIDLGANGYFIIYNSAGDEIMHPTLEGQNVIDVTSFDDDKRFLVQDQIDAGKSGGGFTYYSWMLPHSTKIARKISYSEYYEPWDWIVVATAYEIDFNRGASVILLAIVITMMLLIISVSFLIIKFVRGVTTPIFKIVEGFGKVTVNQLVEVENTSRRDEIGMLIDGYNHMISSLQEANENIAEKDDYIKFLAFHDDLTGLPNRHGIEEHISGRIKTGCNAAYMVQADIWGLNIINSALGYKQGDRLLQVIGEYFLKSENKDLYLARTSSNEFTMWVENRSHKEISELVYDLRKSVKDYINKSGYGRLVNMHLAMTTYPLDGNTFSELYEKTCIALKTAKDSNSLKLNEYLDDFKENIENELSMRQYLTKALEEDEIRAFYQAQVDIATGFVAGVEALARWESIELGYVPPSIFIPAISSQNLVNEFSLYMIDKVLGDYSALKQKYNEDISVSINISPSYFMDKSFLDNLNTRLKKYSIPAEKLTLEITEDVFISDIDKINSIISQLHNMGVRISIDDFGTGYSSLNYLTKMNFDEMKIDKSFINKIIEEPKSMELFKVLCQIAEIYDYEIVAEGVETELQLEMIKTTPLRIVQGYLFSKPEPLQ